MKIIHPDTRLIALLGKPLAQSVSAEAHNLVYREMGWNYFYIPIEVQDKKDLPAVVQALKTLPFAGFAVTKPYKMDIMEFLDDMDETTRRMGSCNTVVIGPEGTLTGYNTDGSGALRSLEEQGMVCEGSVCFCFGAGGVGHSICLELAARGAKHLYIADFEAPAAGLAAHLNEYYPGVATAIPLGHTEEIEKAVAKCGVVMNLTGLGMAPHLEETPLDKSCFRPEMICFDAVYNPGRTRFLREAEEAGCRVVNGLGMLVYQGTRQVALWTGEEEPVAQMTAHMTAAARNHS